MLKNLQIKNFAIIENTSIDFDDCFNVLIGETGAGKSIILSALNFVLGAKPDKQNIRYGTNALSVRAFFECASNNVKNILEQFDIEYEQTIILSRSFSLEGKSTCTINGMPATVGMLKKLGSALCDVYAQHDGVELLRDQNYLSYIDSINGYEITNQKQKIQELYFNLKDKEKLLYELGGNGEEREYQIEILKKKIQELTNANLKTNEDDEIRQRIKKLENFSAIYNNLSTAIDCIDNSHLSLAATALSNLSSFSAEYQTFENRFTNAYIEIEDIEQTLSDIINNLSYSESEIDTLNERLAEIKSVTKKFGGSIESAHSSLAMYAEKLDKMENSDFIIDKTQREINKLKDQLFVESKILSDMRKTNAKALEKNMDEQFSSLCMKNASLKIQFNDVNCIDDANLTNDGYDEVEFLFSANTKNNYKSLSKTISGGELSRFMLALKNALVTNDSDTLLVFDEIDSGVSGEVGLEMGKKLYDISKKYQVLCITHLPQVTAFATKSIFVKKDIVDNNVKSISKELTSAEQKEYISSLFGSGVSKAAILHTEELLEIVNAHKKA